MLNRGVLASSQESQCVFPSVSPVSFISSSGKVSSIDRNFPSVLQDRDGQNCPYPTYAIYSSFRSGEGLENQF